MNILGVTTKVHKDCGHCAELPAEVLSIPYDIWTDWLFLMQANPDREWAVVGDVVEKMVEAYRIPEQVVTSVETELKEDLGGNLHVHSHHSMSPGPSAQDERQVKPNYEYCIILSHKGYYACKKIDLPCGGLSYQKIDLEIIGTDLLEQSDKLITERKIIQNFTPPTAITKPTSWYSMDTEFCEFCNLPLAPGEGLVYHDVRVCSSCVQDHEWLINSMKEEKERESYPYESYME